MKKLLQILLVIIMMVVIFSNCTFLNIPGEEGYINESDTVRLNIGDKHYFKINVWVRLDSLTQVVGDSSSPCAWLTMKFPDTLFHVGLNEGENKGSSTNPWGGYGGHNMRYLSFGHDDPGNVNPIGDPYVEIKYSYLYFPPGVDKPNIYLYPTKKTSMTVSLDLPSGAKVTESIPAYPKKWKNIRVKPDGTINNKYEYLFYEADVPGDWQFDKGWVVAQKDLKFFFQKNLRDYGFNKKEIKDFTDWWIPRLKDHPYYEIYPQHTARIESIVPLKISKEFDSLLRLFYFLEGADVKRDIPEPTIPKFKREGFVVTEWGVSIR